MSTSEQYLDLLQQLLPPGDAWSREPDAVITKLLHGTADELARVHRRMLDLIEEADPRTTEELLPDWERVAGLPDPCAGGDQTVEERRVALTAKLTSRGGQSRQFFIDLAARYGFAITIDEFAPFVAGSGAGEPLYDDGARFVWRVNEPSIDDGIRYFVAGSFAGEPLASWGNETLECVIRPFAPAHTHVIFAAPTIPLLLQDGDVLELQDGELFELQ